MKRLVLTLTLALGLLFGLSLTADAAYREVPVPREAQRLGAVGLSIDYENQHPWVVSAYVGSDVDAICAAVGAGPFLRMIGTGHTYIVFTCAWPDDGPVRDGR